MERIFGLLFAGMVGGAIGGDWYDVLLCQAGWLLAEFIGRKIIDLRVGRGPVGRNKPY